MTTAPVPPPGGGPSPGGASSPAGVPPPPPSATGRSLGPAGALALAGATVGGALVARPVTLVVPALVVLAGIALRRPVLLVAAAALAASTLGARAEAGMAPPEPGPVDGEVTLVGDPRARWGAVEAVARLDGRLVLLEAEGSAAEVVRPRLAGERMAVAGRLGPLPAQASWLRVRHVAARLRVTEATPAGPAAVPWRAANHLRRTLADGVAGLPPDERSLFVGLVLGDERDQRPELTDDFRGSGLSHLLAVSGQNVAFVLVLVAPVLRRAGPTARVVLVLAVLGLFATVTRFEPSVLRAVAMAATATVASVRGRPTAGVHLLALAVTGLVLVDPFLARSVGFQLSVAATAGIVLLAPRLVAVLPGPPGVALPVAVTGAAQLGVGPVLVAVFGGVPVASLPANVLAGPAAGVVMTWGLPAGVLAGLVPATADVAHLPTRLALGWIAGVARGSAAAPLGELGIPHLVALAVALGLAAAAGRVRARWPLRVGAVGLAVTALLAPAAALTRPPVLVEAVPGIAVWRSGGATVVVVAPATGARATLEGLRLAGVRRIDLLVVGPGSSAGDAERAVRHRLRPAVVHWLGRDAPGVVRVGGLVVATGDEGSCVVPAPREPCPVPAGDP